MKPLEIPPWVSCSGCGAPITIQDTYTTEYFDKKSVVCPSCNAVLDWWATVLREVRENFMMNQAFGPVGAQSVIFRITLRPGERTQYKLSDHGIPSDAKVLYVNYTPEGTLFPVELHGNVPTQRSLRSEVTLWPVPFGSAAETKTTDVNVLVTWVPHSQLDESWGNLVDAFEAYAAGSYHSAVVPANVAVEAALSVFLFEYLARYAGRDRVKRFLEDAATYSHQLNVLLPFVSALGGVPELPHHIRGLLNRLRELRNQIAHNGKLETLLSQGEAAELLCSALFGFRYVGLVQSRLARKPT